MSCKDIILDNKIYVICQYCTSGYIRTSPCKECKSTGVLVKDFPLTELELEDK